MPGHEPIIDEGRTYVFQYEQPCLDVVTRSMTRLWCEMVEDANPLYHDAAFARQRGFRDVIAPPTMFLAWTAEPTWTPDEGRRRPHVNALPPVPGLPNGAVIDIGLSVHRPFEIGEQLHAVRYLSGPSALTSTRRGRGRLIRDLVSLRTTDGEEVAAQRSTVLRFDTIEGASVAPEPPGRAPTLLQNGVGSIDRRQSRAVGDIREADVLPTLCFDLPLPRFMLAVAATRDFYEVHHDREFARSIGAPDMFIGTHFMQGLIGRYVNDWCGPDWYLRRLDLVPHERNHPGDTIAVTGRVMRAPGSDEVSAMTLAIVCSNDRAVSHEATVILGRGDE